MSELTVFSPHWDDAAFSLCLSLARWHSLGLKLRIVNFFTVSAYGPRAHSPEICAISSLRAREDRQALRLISREVRIESLNLLDAPLRLNITTETVCRPQNLTWLPDETKSLASRIKRYFNPGLVLAPLGLGAHVDHLAVKNAAIRSSPDQKLAFYEDLPYATWTSEPSLRERISETEEQTGVPLKAAVIRATSAIWKKRRVIGYYKSQISRDEASTIAGFAAKYGGGERIWIPRHGREWKPLAR